MHNVLRQVTAAGHRAELVSFSALDRYFNIGDGPYLLVETDAGLADLAKLFDSLRFPGTSIADAVVGGAIGSEQGDFPVYFTCRDTADPNRPVNYRVLQFYWDAARGRFRDPADVYPDLRDLWKGLSLPWTDGPEPGAEKYSASMDAAVLISRYGSSIGPRSIGPRSSGPWSDVLRALEDRLSRLREGFPPPPERQQQVLAYLLSSPRPELGLTILKETGFVAQFWPELAAMDYVDHSKEYHPEGNAWEHTLETFRYRKKEDLLLSLGLLLHDVGKPISESSSARRFDRHAELGADVAGKFLRRMGFSDTLTQQVRYLVRNHMMPAALPRLPLNRAQETLDSPLFPTLLELYRCDESSSFKGPGGYYKSSAAYRTYLRNLKNPYRSGDGKKLPQWEV